MRRVRGEGDDSGDKALPKVRRYRGRVVKHRSTLEDKIIKNLKDRGVEYEYEPRTFDYDDPVPRGFCRDCNSKAVFKRRRYTPDLKIREFWVEIKGKLDSSTRSRMEAFLKDCRNEGLDLRFIFQRDNWITKAHKSKYSDWAKKLGVKYHIGQEVPEEWTSSTKTI